MNYKYVSWAIGGRFQGGHLLPRERAAVIVKDIITRGYDCYATIQNYNDRGELYSCPIYLDFDSSDITQSFVDAREFVKAFTAKYNIKFSYYFSGNKGVHLVGNYLIYYEDAHKVISRLVSSVGSYPSLDFKVYTGRRLWRITNSLNTKSNRFKIELTEDEFFNKQPYEIKELAKQKRPFNNIEYSVCSSLDKDIDLLILDEQEKKKQDANKSIPQYTPSVLPCILKILANEAVEGERNLTINTVLMSLSTSGYSIEDAELIMLESNYNNDQEVQREIIKVAKSLAVTGVRKGAGCKTGIAAPILKRYCTILCHLNEQSICLK